MRRPEVFRGTLGSEDGAELRQKVPGKETVLDALPERALRADLMPGIDVPDAGGVPVLHDAVLPFEPGGVALSVLRRDTAASTASLSMQGASMAR